jgi:hypothetical protein
MNNTTYLSDFSQCESNATTSRKLQGEMAVATRDIPGLLHCRWDVPADFEEQYMIDVDAHKVKNLLSIFKKSRKHRIIWLGKLASEGRDVPTGFEGAI